jgi:hypothetical protein
MTKIRTMRMQIKGTDSVIRTVRGVAVVKTAT